MLNKLISSMKNIHNFILEFICEKLDSIFYSRKITKGIIFLYDDGVDILLMKDHENRIFLYVLIDDIFEKYIVIELSKDRLHSFLNDEIDLRNLFLYCEKGEYYFAYLKNKYISKFHYSIVKPEYFAEEGFYISKFLTQEFKVFCEQFLAS